MLTTIQANFQGGAVRTLFQTTGGTVFTSTDDGLYQSESGGKGRKPVYQGGCLAKWAESKGVLLATSQEGILRSTDDGERWDRVISEGGVGIAVESIKGEFAAITCNTESKTRRVHTSYDSGKTWAPIDARPSGKPLHSFHNSGWRKLLLWSS